VGAPPTPAAPETRVIDRGEAVGRFVLIGLLGRGGMGEVYAAYDPELDRKVAVKILRLRSADGEARLLREAQAIAKLQHPNVVVVYDVGSFRDTVFIAMEFVDGHTLGYWMNAEPRPWRDVLKIFQAAGRGLEAAHELGMVHRDFKPDNVMLTKDGQVRVMDFGLARQVGDREGDGKGGAGPAPAPPTPRPEADLDSTMPVGHGGPSGPVNVHSSPGYLNLKLTQTGVQIGTPAYMAPEQFAGKRSDARSDQFSFCVALYEALYGQRPFGGDTMIALTAAVLAGEVRPTPEKSRVPGWVRRVLLRGLSLEPDDRFPSMKALLAALEQDPSTARRRWLAAGSVAVLVGGLGFAASRAGTGARTLCAGGGAKLAGLWEPGGEPSPRKEAIRAAFAGTGKSFAAQSLAAASKLLDDYVGRWTAMYTDACEATNVRGEQSAEVLDLRMGCLRGRLENVRALTDVFAKADGDVVVNAVSAAGALPPLDACADVAALRAVIKPPDDPAIRKRVDDLRAELARVTAIRDAGGCAEAEKRGVKLIEDVRATKYRPLLAESLGVVGFMGNFCADPAASTARAKESYAEAIASNDAGTAAFSAAVAVILLADRLGQAASARDWLMLANASLDRMTNRQAHLGNILSAEAVLLGAEHDYEGWIAKNREAVTMTAKVYGPDHSLALTGLSNLGNALTAAGRYDEAIAVNANALASAERVLGGENPIIANMSNNACEALNHAGRFGEALKLCRRALDVWRVAGTEAVIRSYGLTGEGLALLGLGKPGEAIAPLEEAVATRVAAHVGPALEGEARFALARALWSKPAERPRALAYARQARTDYVSEPKTVAEIDAWLAKAK
jgi:tetratricopeptide (TPR) repeat protein/predicted Ser/Thr protein kinase